MPSLAPQSQKPGKTGSIENNHPTTPANPPNQPHLLPQLLGNQVSGNIMHPKSGMQRVQPKVLINRDPTSRIIRVPTRRAILIRNAVVRRVLVRTRLHKRTRPVEHGVEDLVRVEEEGCGVAVRGRQVPAQRGHTGVPVRDGGRLEGDGCGALGGGQGRAVDGGDVQEEEVARAGDVEFVDEARVHCEDVGGEGGVLRRVAVADVVDADEDCEERV